MKTEKNSNNKKKSNIITKRTMLKKMSKQLNLDVEKIKIVYDALENVVQDYLTQADNDTDIIIKLFDGITICGSYKAEKEKFNNLTGKVITTKKKIKPTANITRYYCEKISSNIK